ncbi:hypothetical protein [Empedobacter sp. 189-2]|uniref:hypothetical protein n=1 Tax=Empedobacter sp. 189-2 TaxID=2746724 RepID=UPI0025749441|nr:hypothetical protein [Empedobacter sp. 189-2]MDM1542374.1 hypothetical protein [Empedobacter sp. 189-2]
MYTTIIGNIYSINGKTFYDEFTTEFGYYSRIDVVVQTNNKKYKVEFKNKKKELLKNVKIGQTVEIYCYNREYFYEKIEKKIKSLEAERLNIIENPHYQKSLIQLNDNEYYLKKYYVDSKLMLELIDNKSGEIISISFLHEFSNININTYSTLIKLKYKDNLIPILEKNGIIEVGTYLGNIEKNYAGYICRLIVNNFDQHSILKINI